MASGHTVGLVTGQAFRRAEAEIRQRRVMEASEVDAELSGKGAETVYRDRRGRKLDMLNEFMRQQAQNEGKAVQEKQEQYEWGGGTVQKNNERQFEEELANIKDQPFARHAGDAQLEAMRRQEIRDGDPMAEFMRSKGLRAPARPPSLSTRDRHPNLTGLAFDQAIAGMAATVVQDGKTGLSRRRASANLTMKTRTAILSLICERKLERGGGNLSLPWTWIRGGVRFPLRKTAPFYPRAQPGSPPSHCESPPPQNAPLRCSLTSSHDGGR